jgi:hypothetical protein
LIRSVMRDQPQHWQGGARTTTSGEPTTTVPSDVSRRRFIQSPVAAVGAAYSAIGLTAAAGRFTSAGSRSEEDLAYLSIEEASALIKSKRLSPVELVQACLCGFSFIVSAV